MASKYALMRLTNRLLARRDALRKTLSGDLDAFLEVSQASGVGDDVDLAVDAESDEIYSQLVEIESNELAQIERALERIAEGAYGYCEFCGGKIPAARLEAVPYTTSCIDCQRANERARTSKVQDRNSPEWAEVGEMDVDEDLDEAMARTGLNELEMLLSQSRQGYSNTVLV